MVERNPRISFFYASRGPDLALKQEGRLPPNCFPTRVDQEPDGDAVRQIFAMCSGIESWSLIELSRIGAAFSGARFDVVDVPSFRPVVSRLRHVLKMHRVSVGKVALSLLGWQSMSLKSAYAAEQDAAAVAELERIEQSCVADADIRYAISDLELHQAWEIRSPVAVLDMHDTLEELRPSPVVPASSGKPQLWYVGRLDGAKAPDLFLDIASRVDPGLHGGCVLTGPDNDWSTGERWSDHLKALAREKGVAATYAGRLSDAEIRSRVYGGRTVVVIPSRTDTFNYVALEATLSGCPVILSRQTGAHRFFAARHPELAPVSMAPDDPAGAAEALSALLAAYDDHKAGLLDRLQRFPMPRPRIGFMSEIYGAG